jgi:hypothetical protein
LQAVPEGAATSDPAALHDSIHLASAVGPEGGTTSGGGAAGADVLLPFGSSIRFSDLSLSQKSSGGGSAAGSTAVSSTGGSLAGVGSATGAAAGAGLGPGAAADAAKGSPADPFFQMRSTSSGTSGGGGPMSALLLSRSTSAGSADPAGGRGTAAGAVSEEGPAGFGSIGGAGGSDSGAAASAQPAEQQQGSNQVHPEITPLSPTGPQQLPHQQQQQPSQQQEEQPPAPNLPHVRTSLPGQSEGRGSGGGGFSSSSPSSGSPLRQRLSGVGSGGSPGRTRMGALVLPQLMVSSPESVEVVQPAFMRLEAEGGLLLIQVRGGGRERGTEWLRGWDTAVLRAVCTGYGALVVCAGCSSGDPLQAVRWCDL